MIGDCMKNIKKILKPFSVMVGLILGIYIFSFIMGCILKKSYTEIELEAITNIFYTNINVSKPNFFNYLYTKFFFWYMILRIVTLSLVIVLINLKNKAHRVLKYIGTSLVLSSCFIILLGVFYNNILNILDDNLVNLILASNYLKPNLITFGSSFLILGLFLHVTYSTIDVLYDEIHNRKKISGIESK